MDYYSDSDVRNWLNDLDEQTPWDLDLSPDVLDEQTPWDLDLSPDVLDAICLGQPFCETPQLPNEDSKENAPAPASDPMIQELQHTIAQLQKE